MIYLVIYIFALTVALGTGFLAGRSDFKGMTIPNALSLIVAATFIAAFSAASMADVEVFHSVKNHGLTLLGAFILTFILFSVRVIGGGDAKLITAYSLWTGAAGLVNFLFFMAIFGAVLGAIALIIKKTQPFKNPAAESWIGRVQAGQSAIPYGIPIVIGAIIAFSDLGYLAPETMQLFLDP